MTEVQLHWPASTTAPAPALAEVEAALQGRPQAWVEALERHRPDRDGIPVPVIPAVVEWPGGEGYGWSLRLSRARIDVGGQEVAGESGGVKLAGRLDPQDPYCDELFQVQVRVLRGFEPAAAAGPSEHPLPDGNVPVERFVFLVGLP